LTFKPRRRAAASAHWSTPRQPPDTTTVPSAACLPSAPRPATVAAPRPDDGYAGWPRFLAERPIAERAAHAVIISVSLALSHDTPRLVVPLRPAVAAPRRVACLHPTPNCASRTRSWRSTPSPFARASLPTRRSPSADSPSPRAKVQKVTDHPPARSSTCDAGGRCSRGEHAQDLVAQLVEPRRPTGAIAFSSCFGSLVAVKPQSSLNSICWLQPCVRPLPHAGRMVAIPTDAEYHWWTGVAQTAHRGEQLVPRVRVIDPPAVGHYPQRHECSAASSSG